MYIPTYKRVLGIKDEIGDACNPSMSMDEIKKYEDVVTMPRSVTVSDFFTMELTDVAKEMHAANLSVHVTLTSVTQLWRLLPGSSG